MNSVEKYENIEEVLPKLPKILLNTIQSDVLEIRKVNKLCKKYLSVCDKKPDIKNAVFVVYSKYIKKSDHSFEKFVFLDEQGAEICHVSGIEMDLYGLLECTKLELTEEYKALVDNKE
ncbi:MAG: hypothetical protein OQK48_04750 [Sulfurimonas sp.]|uniref:hypothetical protein n=1 Tax=Sulfurimonas sp. TaxID=2022749 RepID=UPI0026378F42|nr:hypothetical protein [Sulfurimonas sp.]MCW8894310.1 hypothetical protein [Sulfurimonas sp.]MCW8954232.1 hypothetical protein [Sulfurimonas sp.]MCW9068000.1 hypothetical protein [Sulfurimonas sp.]